MSKLTALVEAANNDNSDDMEINADALAGYGDTILELCALLEKAESNLQEISSDNHYSRVLRKEALDAIKQWKERV